MIVSSILILSQAAMAQGPAIDWNYLPFGHSTKPAGMAADPGGGAPYLAGRTEGRQFSRGPGWHVYRFDATLGNFKILRSSSLYEEDLAGLAAADLEGNGSQELLILERSGRLEVQDFLTGAVLFDRTLDAHAELMVLADLDGDQATEIILELNNTLRVYDRSGSFLWSLALGSLVTDMVAGQCDSDVALEIVTSKGVVDGVSQSLQWNGALFGDLGLIEADGDAALEVVANANGFLHIYDVETQALLRSSQDTDANELSVLDVDGDGVDELLMTEYVPGSLKAYDPFTLAEIWSQPLASAYYGEYPVLAGDLDDDGDQELLYFQGIVYDAVAAAELWRPLTLEGPYVGAEIGDLDGDGRNELVTACSISPNAFGGRILVFDEPNRELLGISDPVLNPALAQDNRIYDLKLRDVDQDGRQEILVASSYLGYPAVGIYEFSGGAFSEIWVNATQPQGEAFSRVEAADLDSDGDVEILATTFDALNAPQFGNRLYVYDFNSAQEEWVSAQLDSNNHTSSGLEVGDFDRDGDLEIAVMVTEGSIHVFGGPSHLEEAVIPGSYNSLRQYATGPVRVLLAGTEDGWFEVWRRSGAGYAKIFSEQVSNQEVESVRVLNVLNYMTIWTIHDNVLDVRFPGAGNPVWTAKNLGWSPGRSFTVSQQTPFTFYVTSASGIHRLKL